MSNNEQNAFNPREFAALIVPPANPYQGYDARQAELAQKDHPWANPVSEPNEVLTNNTNLKADEARQVFHDEMEERFQLTGPDNRTDAERRQQVATNMAGRKLVEAALAAAKNPPNES